MSGKPALSKVAVLERDRQRNCTLVKVFLLFHLISDALYQYMPLAFALARHTRIRKQKAKLKIILFYAKQVEIQSGRPHQIRIHLAYIGHPLVGKDFCFLLLCLASHLELILFCATCAVIALHYCY